jgi:predicted  nucleic acid-binding Zn-ribbon protein
VFLADAQRQERMEQMIADINKYKKLDKELTNLRQQHQVLEKDFNSKIENITHQRDGLQVHCDQLKEKIQQYEQLQIKYNQLIQNNSTNANQQELNTLKAKNDQLQQQNCKLTEELNKFSNKQQNNSKTKSS